MLRRFALVSGIAVLASSTLLADFSYQETSTITGGMVARMMKFAGVFSKKAREPIQSTIAVKGNKMLHRTADSASIIDLDAQTITSINFRKHTYSVMTFEQMKQMLAQPSEKMKQQSNNGQNAQMQFKVSAKSTGAVRQISGYDTKETLVKMEMEATDQKSGQTGAMVITTDMWLAPSVSGYSEVRDFYKRISEKINWTPGQNMFMMSPQVSEGMAEVYKEAAKMDGVPVLQTITMGAAGENAAAAANQQQAAQQQSEQQESETPSMTDAVGGALAGHFGFGHRRHKKQQREQPEQQQAAQTSGSGGTLLEMTVESSNFSSSPVNDSLFAIPSGFREVKPDTRHMPH